MLIVSFKVRRSDFVWMYLGSWGLWIAIAPGLVGLAIGLSGIVPGLVGLPVNPDVPLTNVLFMVGFGLIALVVGPAYLCFLLARMNRIGEVVGKTVALSIDARGVWDWPLAEEIDTTWANASKARRLGGVTTLLFPQFGTRRGWIPIPDRALSVRDRQVFRDLLASNGLTRSHLSRP